MNVKPGDLAKVVGVPESSGTLVEVITRSPEYIEPNWVCRLISGARGFKWDGRTWRTCYGLPGALADIADVNLQRIDPKADDTVDEAPVSAEVSA